MTRARGSLFGIGVGPGDPELITLKALRYLRSASVIAYYAGQDKSSNALTTVNRYLLPKQQRLPLIYPATSKIPPPPFDYEKTLREFYDKSATRIADQLDSGHNVAALCEGDPLFYGSFMYLHDRLADRYQTQIIPGICSIVAGAAALRTPLVYRDQSFLVLSGTLPEEKLSCLLTKTEAAAILKLGSHFEKVRRVLKQLNLLERALYIERATMEGERIALLSEIDPATVPYFSLILIPGIRWGE